MKRNPRRRADKKVWIVTQGWADGGGVGVGGGGLNSPPAPTFHLSSPPPELARMARLKGGMWGKWVVFHAAVRSSPGLRGDNDRGSGIPEAAV